MNDRQKIPIYEESQTEPGVYEYRADLASELRQRDAELWNDKAVAELQQLYERLGVPTRLR